MRSYGQYCGLAKALDVVGDRWTLLIVRELMLLGPSRYTDLREGLPGIATNLLVDRLREMEDAGLVTREDAPPPVASTLFRLTPRGEALRPVIKALGSWAGPELGSPRRGEAYRGHWLALPLGLHLVDRRPKAGPFAIEVHSKEGDRPITITSGDQGDVRITPGPAQDPDTIVSGAPDVILAALLGRTSLATAKRQGLRVEGSGAVLQRIGASP